MFYTYVQAIGIGFPEVQVSATGDGSAYTDIVWVSGAPMPDQVTLDQWIAANPVGSDRPRHVTNLAFRNRFTIYEKTIIEFAASDDPAAELNDRMNAAFLRASLKDSEAAAYIDLDRLDTRGGVLQLEALGILAEGRALVILDSPVQENEVPTYPPKD